MIYRRFEEIPVWQHSRKFISEIYKITPSHFKRDYNLIDQLRRASVSICLNIAEGFERKGNKEFAHFIHIAKGSAGEVRTILYIAKDLGYIAEAILAKLLMEIESISKQLSRFAQFLSKS